MVEGLVHGSLGLCLPSHSALKLSITHIIQTFPLATGSLATLYLGSLQVSLGEFALLRLSIVT